MTVADLVAAMEKIAPTRLAEAWDNVGLIVGDPAEACERVLLCIDLTPAVLAEAVTLRCQAVVAYHPPVFEGVKRLVAGSVAFDAARRGIAVYSPHTALDVAAGGTNDVMAEAMGLGDLRPLRPSGSVEGSVEGSAQTRECKLVTFVPEDAVECVSEALFAAGAGRIGRYTHCSFLSKGTGTFVGEAGADPAVGEAGRLEKTAEVRLETVVSAERIGDAVRALRSAHPYEEPAFDLLQLAARPESSGIGRVGDLPSPTPLHEIVSRLKAALSLSRLLLSGSPDALVSRVALCAGAGRSLVPEVLRAKADLYLTGELPHHDALRLSAGGVAALCTLHSNSERPVLARLAQRLAGFTCLVSERDRDPFAVV